MKDDEISYMEGAKGGRDGMGPNTVQRIWNRCGMTGMRY